ncbi:hypothetical protein BGP_4229 [Beggiatoa sp. PS]|nr:hypothetical protein BGP_4229 [Beggiatoa sp. PS]
MMLLKNLFEKKYLICLMVLGNKISTSQKNLKPDFKYQTFLKYQHHWHFPVFSH